MDNFPSAVVIASYDSVCHNNNVLHRLVRPLPDGSGVQSTDRLVNVVPYRRKYTFERKQELVDFGQQILRRPLVLQPVLHFGRGFRNCCATCYNDELWLVMVNQTHPKILSRLQMGLDSAKVALKRGQPFEIRFRFGKIIQRAYKEHLAQKEREEAEASSSAFQKYLTYFRYAEWEYCDLNLRYHGLGATVNRTSAFKSLPNLEIKWDFEDIGMHEMVWSQFNDEQIYPNPHLSPVSEDELRQHLPGWTINGVSPLENIGDSIPEYHYDYAQAGRLYASFRKKQRPRNRSHQNDIPRSQLLSNNSSDESYHEEDFEEEHVGAVGFSSSAEPAYVNPGHVAIEHDFRYPGSNESKHPTSRRRCLDSTSSYNQIPYHEKTNQAGSDPIIHEQPYYANEVSGPIQGDRGVNNVHKQSSNGRHPTNSLTAASQPDRYGHIYSNVEIRSPKTHLYQNQTQSSIGTQQYTDLSANSNHMHDPSLSTYNPIKKQDSDRSSRSTIADSGYCPEGDSDRSRGGSYDYNEQSYMPRLKEDHYMNFPSRSVADDDGLVNPAFSIKDQDTDHAMQNDKQFVLKTGKKTKRLTAPVSDYSLDYNNSKTQSPYSLSPKDCLGDVMKAPPRQKRGVTSTGTPKIAESFI